MRLSRIPTLPLNLPPQPAVGAIIESMRRLWLVFLLPWLLSADSGWVKYASGPFEVYTNGNERLARETLVRFEEFRHAVGQVIGETELKTPRPVRIVMFKNAKGWTSPGPLGDGRDAYTLALEEKAAVSPDVYRALTRLFLDSNTGRMPEAFERGLVEFFSTFDVNGSRIVAGVPPPKPDLDWARVHLLVGDPEYFGRLRVLLFNLRRGVVDDVAYSNAFGKKPAEVEEQARRHLTAGNFQRAPLSSRPMSESDFHERAISDSDARLARADLLAGPQSAAEYQALLRDRVKVAEAEEGLGLLALRAQQSAEAAAHFKAAVEAGTASARAYIEYARLEPDAAKAEQALLHAAGINPQLDEPFALMARRDVDPRKRLAHWKAAAERNPRNAEYWQRLAECYLEDHNYGDAAKAWTSGEQAATDPVERSRMRAARLAIEQQRLDYEAVEKKRKAEEDARELEKLKAQARADLHAAENKANNGAPQTSANAVPWWDGPQAAGKLQGSLTRVDCLGAQARLTVESADHKIVKLLVADPGKVAINGPGDISLGCGAQKARRVIIEYHPKANSRLGTAGEVASIEFK
jgi:hypothetical protein